MITTSEALVLRIAPFSRTSHIVTWLTPQQGQIATIVKGALRPKSSFLGQYDLYYTCELLYYSRERNGLHIAKECSPLHLRPGFRTDWRSACAASYVCDMLARVSTPGGHEQDLYALASEVLDELSMGHSNVTLLLWFEITLARLLGIAPQLSSCIACGADVHTASRPLFVALQGGLLCPRCSHRDSRNGIVVPAAVLAILRSWQKINTARAAMRTICTAEQVIALKLLLGVFFSHHVDVSPRSRQIAVEVLAPNNRCC